MENMDAIHDGVDDGNELLDDISHCNHQQRSHDNIRQQQFGNDDPFEDQRNINDDNFHHVENINGDENDYSSDDDDFREIKTRVGSREIWAVSNIPIEVVTVDPYRGSSSAPPVVKNLASFIGPESDSDDPRKKFKSLMSTYNGKGSKLYLPNFNQNNEEFRHSTIHPFIQSLFAKHGDCRVVAKGWEKKGKCIKFVCERSRVYDSEQRKLKKRMQSPNIKTRNRTTTNKKPTCRDDTCGFHFSLYWDPTVSRWFVYERNPGRRFHHGHLPLAAQAELANIRESMKTSSPYTYFLPQYEHMCQQIITVEQCLLIQDAMRKMANMLLHQNQSRAGKRPLEGDLSGLASLPKVDGRKRSKNDSNILSSPSQKSDNK